MPIAWLPGMPREAASLRFDSAGNALHSLDEAFTPNKRFSYHGDPCIIVKQELV